MKLLLLVICSLIEINYSTSVLLQSFLKQAKQNEFLAKLINQKQTAIVESKNEKFKKNSSKSSNGVLISDLNLILGSTNCE